jgi:hypothetical protein
LSSEEGFFDVVFLGIFVVLSPAFDSRFYGSKPPSHLADEASCAKAHFLRILHTFNERFRILLGGDVVSHSYVVDRMLGEFAAAAVVFAMSVQDNRDDGITTLMFQQRVEDILEQSHPKIHRYYSRCLDRVHKHFLWTGPKVDIIPRSEASDLIFAIDKVGIRLDLPPPEMIYLDATADDGIPPDAKSHGQADGVDEGAILSRPPRKRRS